MQVGISTDLAWKVKQGRMLKLKNKPTLEGLRRTEQRAIPKVWIRTCWWSGLVCDLCTCIVHLQLKKKKEKENASSNKLRNYVQIYSTKIMHL